MGLVLNYTKPEFKERSQQLKPLQPGLYPATMTAYEEAMSSNNNPQAVITYTIDAGAEAGAGRIIKNYYTLTPKALWRWENDMVALGGIDADYFDSSNTKVDVAAVCEGNLKRKGTLQLADPDPAGNPDFNKLIKVRPRS